MQDLPGPGIESVSPALAGRFFPTEPRGTSSSSRSFALSASVIWPYFDGIQSRPPPSMSLKCTDSFEIKLLWKQCKKKALTLLCPHECQKYIYHRKLPYLHQKDVRHREYEIRNSRPRKLYKQISFVTSIVCCPKQNSLCFVKFSLSYRYNSCPLWSFLWAIYLWGSWMCAVKFDFFFLFLMSFVNFITRPAQKILEW